MGRRVRFDDSGQGMLPLMVLVAFSILVITFSLLVPWGAATTEKAQSQTAADAAALAAVQGKRELWDQGVRAGVLSMVGTPALQAGVLAAGCPAAQAYAASNDARVVSCSETSRGGRSAVAVEVENLRTSDADTGRARSVATAQMDIDFPGCRWGLLTLPPPPPTGPPTFENTLTCGPWEATYEVGNVPGVYPTITLTRPAAPSRLYNDLEPRLVD